MCYEYKNIVESSLSNFEYQGAKYVKRKVAKSKKGF